MARLRDPDHGCPWDLEQSFATIAPHTLEEAYEVVDAIERGDLDHLREELGDLLFQVVYYAQLARERDLWDFEDVARAIVDKMIERHPHVFGTATVEDAEAMTRHWEAAKAERRAEEARSRGEVPSALDGVVIGLPALTRSVKLQKRAARVGFDWTDPARVLDKIMEEVAELRAELDRPETSRDPAAITDELGDVLFTISNLARHLDVDPEVALRGANA